MVIADFSGDFVNFKSTKDGQVATILSECMQKHNSILNKDIWDMDVEIDGKKKTYSPNNVAGQTLTAAFGEDTKDWIGCQFEIMHVNDKMAIRPVNKA